MTCAVLSSACFNPESPGFEDESTAANSSGATKTGSGTGATGSEATDSRGSEETGGGAAETTPATGGGTTSEGDTSTNGTIGPSVCEPGSAQCDGNVLQTCRADGSGFDPIEACEPGLCDGPGAQCDLCQAGVARCHSDAEQAICADDGQSFVEASCPDEAPFCVGDGRCVQCIVTEGCLDPAPPCQVPICRRGECSTMPIAAGIDCGFPNVCDGRGACVDDPRKVLAASEQGMRSFDGGTTVLALTFIRVFPQTEDRFVMHYPIAAIPNPVPTVHLMLRFTNLDAGGINGAFALHVFRGDGVGSIDEWNAGVQEFVVDGLSQPEEMHTVNVTAVTQAAKDVNAAFLSIVFRGAPGSTDRINFGSSVGLPPPFLLGDEPLR